jgi:hypothetical protein
MKKYSVYYHMFKKGAAHTHMETDSLSNAKKKANWLFTKADYHSAGVINNKTGKVVHYRYHDEPKSNFLKTLFPHW